MEQSTTPPFLKELKKAEAIIIGEDSPIRIISHYDADGICGAGILSSALKRHGIRFHTTITRSLKDEFIQNLDKEGPHLFLFCDMGSGQIENIENMEGRVIILDHHKPLRPSESVLQVNPHFFGINGTDEASGATLAFLFATELDSENWDLAPLSIAGSIGDKQHIGGFKGLNNFILMEAIEKGSIEVRDGLNFEGKTIKEALKNSLDPYICGISGHEDNTVENLHRLNIPVDSNPDDIGDKERRALVSWLMVKLLRQGSRPESIESIVSDRYWLPNWDLYARDLSNYVNSCGRLDHPGSGVALCLGDKEALERAIKLRTQYKGMVREGLLRLEKEGVHSLSNIQFFYTDNSSVAGAHAGLGMMYFFDQNKPVIALSPLKEVTKVSTRGTKWLVSKGLDLAIACRLSAEEFGGRGGGHPIASGATIPVGKEEKFLERINEIVKGQIET